MILLRIEAQLPAAFRSASIARRYNMATGACLTHWDIERMGIFERDEVLLIAESGDILF